MKRIRMVAAAVLVAAGLLTGGCSGLGSSCAGAATIHLVERGGGSGSGSSGSRSGSSYSGSRGSGSSSGYSGSRSGSYTYSGSRSSSSYTGSGTRTNTIIGSSGQRITYNVPSSIGSRYTYLGHTFSYHPESYWMSLGLPNPDNPYDTRNYNNPYSPFYHYHLAVSGC